VLVHVPALVPVLKRIANCAPDVTSSDGEEAILEILETTGNYSYRAEVDS